MSKHETSMEAVLRQSQAAEATMDKMLAGLLRGLPDGVEHRVTRIHDEFLVEPMPRPEPGEAQTITNEDPRALRDMAWELDALASRIEAGEAMKHSGGIIFNWLSDGSVELRGFVRVEPVRG